MLYYVTDKADIVISDSNFNDYIHEFTSTVPTVSGFEPGEYYVWYHASANNSVNFIDGGFGRVKVNIQQGIVSPQPITVIFESCEENDQNTFNYNLETHSHLILPIISQIVKENEIVLNQTNQKDFNTYDYLLATENNIYLEIKDSNKNFADIIFKMINETKGTNNKSETINKEEIVEERKEPDRRRQSSRRTERFHLCLAAEA